MHSLVIHIMQMCVCGVFYGYITAYANHDTVNVKVELLRQICVFAAAKTSQHRRITHSAKSAQNNCQLDKARKPHVLKKLANRRTKYSFAIEKYTACVTRQSAAVVETWY